MKHRNRFRTTRDIVIPKGNPVIFVSHVKHEAYRLANSLVRVDADKLFEWTMNFDDALAAGLIEKSE